MIAWPWGQAGKQKAEFHDLHLVGKVDIMKLNIH